MSEAARLTFGVCLAAWLCFALAGPWLMDLFGPGYAPAWMPLMILVTGQLVACLFGPALMVATLAGHVHLTLACLALGMAVNAAVNLLVAPYWGASGAALGTALGALVTAAAAHRLLRSRLGITTALPAMLRPRAAGAAA